MQKRPYLNNKTIRVIFILTVNIVIFFILVETTTLALYFFSHGELFYMRSQNYETIPTPEANENPMLAGNRFHPYFGFVVEPGRIFIPAAHQMIKFEKEEGEKIQPQMWEGVKVNNHGS